MAQQQATDEKRAREAFRRACKAAGSQGKLAEALKITTQAVGQWNGIVPHPRVIDVEKITGVPRHELRPDLYSRVA
jgi:DNA-binding transcriptional regulator YdaS (Cro superfamily)